MPYRVRKSVINAITKRFRKAKPTSQSIIEEHSARGNDAVANLEAGLDGSFVALEKIDPDRSRLEAPRCHLHEYLIGLIPQHQRARGDYRHALLWCQQSRDSEHVRFKPRVGIRKRDTNLGSTRVWVENIADKKD